MPTINESILYLSQHGRAMSARRLLALIHSGRIKAVKHGRDWWIDPTELDRYLAQPYNRNGGRPRKVQS